MPSESIVYFQGPWTTRHEFTDTRRLSTTSPTGGSIASRSRQASVVSVDDSQQGSASTPASSVASDGLDDDHERKPKKLVHRTKPTHKATPIHEEAECSTDPTGMDSGPDQQDDEGGAKSDDNPEVETPLGDRDEFLDVDVNVQDKPKRVLHPVEYDMPYTHPTMPWDKFYSSRPYYPQSMFQSFLEYHKGPLNVLHDLGAGSGLAADGLLTALRPRLRGTDRTLPHTILSDPGQENLEITARFVSARQPGVPLECWKARGEDQDEFLRPGSIDMTICAEALHWMDMPSAVDQVSHSLRAGGTFAAVLYSCFPRVLNSARAKKALRALVEEHLRGRLLTRPAAGDSSLPDENKTSRSGSPISPSRVSLHSNWERGLRYLAYGLDAVELPADQWDDIKRFEINCGSTGWWWPNASKDMLGCATPMADASPHERIQYEDHEEWGRHGNARELKELLMSIQVGFGQRDWEGPRWKELESLVKGPLHFVWQVHMILARKKSQVPDIPGETTPN